MNDLVPSGDFELASLIPIVFSLGILAFVFFFGIRFFQKVKIKKTEQNKEAAKDRDEKKPEALDGSEDENAAEENDSEAASEDEDDENDDENNTSDNEEIEGTTERQKNNTQEDASPKAPKGKKKGLGGLLGSMKRGEKKLPPTPLFSTQANNEEKTEPKPGNKPSVAPKQSKKDVEAEFIIGQEGKNIKLIIAGGKMELSQKSQSPSSDIRKKIILDTDNIDVLQHEKTIYRMTAAQPHNNSANNICVYNKTSFSLEEAMVNDFPEKSEIYPLGAIALYWADKLFGKNIEKKMIILTFVDMVNPFTYIFKEVEEDGKKIIERFITGHEPELERKEIDDSEIFRIDVIFDALTEKEHFDFENEYKYPEVGQHAKIYLNQFIKEVKIKPVMPPGAVELGKPVMFFALCGIIAAATFSGDYLIKKQKESLLDDINTLKEEKEEYNNQALKLWAKRLPQYLRENKINFKPMFETVDKVGRIELLKVKDIIWEKESNKDKFVINASYKNSLGDKHSRDIRERLEKINNCDKKYEYDGGLHETSVVITCNI